MIETMLLLASLATMTREMPCKPFKGQPSPVFNMGVSAKKCSWIVVVFAETNHKGSGFASGFHANLVVLDYDTEVWRGS